MQTNRLLQSVSADIKVISTYLQPSLNSKVQPRNLSELSSLVKNKLEVKLVSKDKKSNCREWLQNKGMNIQPLMEFIANRKKRQKEELKTEQKQATTGVPVLQPTLFNHQEYFQKAFQYTSASIMKYVQTNRAIKKKYFRNAMQRLHCKFQEFPTSSLPSSIPTFTTRNFQKKNLYIKTVEKLLHLDYESKNKRQIFDKGDYQESDRVAKLFFQSVSHKIWNILYRQIKEVNFSQRKETIMAEVLINSLTIVEQEFSQEFPSNKQGIDYYLQQKYLSKIDRNVDYEFDHQHGSIWAKIFLCFRAGRFKQVNKLLKFVKQQDLAKAIIQNSQSLKNKIPKKMIINPFLNRSTKDIFRQQILYAIGGQKKYSSELLADVSTLDCVWVLLRNTGIYYQFDSKVFEEMKVQMAKYYLQNRQERQHIFNAAYLADYDSILTLSENEILDKDDLLHLLIVMQRYPSLIRQRHLISQRLAQLAVSYIVELAEQKREEIVYYILILPEDRIIEDASQIIAAYKLYLTFDWKILKKYLEKNLFEKLVSEASKKFVISTRNYLQTAINLSNLIDQKQSPLNLLTQMLVIHYQEKKIYDEQDVVRALSSYYWLIEQSTELGKKYIKLYELFGSLNALAKASRNRNYRPIEDIIKTSSLIFCQNIDYYNAKMLDKLMQMNGLDVYFIFLSNTSRAADYIYNSQAEAEQKQFNYLLFKTANTVLNYDKYKLACSQQSITKIVTQLSQKMIESAIEDYKNYH